MKALFRASSLPHPTLYILLHSQDTKTGFCLVESFYTSRYWLLKFEFLQFLAINTSWPHLATLNHLSPEEGIPWHQALCIK